MPLELYLLVAGIILMAMELSAPGIGIFGVAGLACLTGSGYYLVGGGMPALLMIAGLYLILIIVLAALFFYLPKESKWNPFVLWDKQRNSEGYTGGQNMAELLGKEGTAITVLRPAGTVLVDGKRLDVISLGEYVSKGAAVRIVKVEGSKIFVDVCKE